MLSRNALVTYLIVTAAALLIWIWAASETRDQSTLFVRVRFAVEGADRWRVEPPQVLVTVQVEGSVRAIGNADAASREGLTVVLPEEPGSVAVDLIERLRRDEIIRASGVTLTSAEPAAVDVLVDRLIPLQATIRPELPPGIQTEGAPQVDPPTATIWVPSLRRDELPGTITVNAYLEQDAIDRLEPGGRLTVPARLQLPDTLPMTNELTVEPTTASLSLTVRSRIRRHTLDSVRVQLAGPHEDYLEYDIRLTPSVLRNVTIEAESDLIRQIVANQATVVAMLHLSNRDKEQGIKEKPVAYFVVLRNGWTRGQPVTVVESAEGTPVVGLDIQRRK